MNKTLFGNLKAILGRYRWRFSIALFMLVVSNLLLILNPLILRQAILSLDAPAPISINQSYYFQGLLGEYQKSVWIWALILFVISLISALMKYGMRLIFIAISRDAEKEIRDKLFHCIQNQSRAFFDRHGIGELLSRLTNDILAYRDLLGPGIMYPLFFLTIIIPGLYALFSISVPLATLSLLPLFLIPLLNEVVRNYSYSLSLTVQETLGKMSSAVQEHYSAIRIIKGYGVENSSLARFQKLCSKFASVSFKMTCLQGMMFPLFTLLTKITTVLLVMLSGVIILNAWEALNVADFISFMWIQSYIFFPVLMLGWVLPVYERGRAAYDRLVEIYSEPIEVKDSPKSSLKIPPKADIYFKNMTFYYPGTTQPALSHLNLRIKGGSFVGITGPIGAGKSTLFHLLNRAYEVPNGTLFIGGNEIHEYPLEAFRSEMITVEQMSFLFSRTVADNVRFGRAEASQEELEVVARYADLHDTVMEFPGKYETMVGEQGITLSGGQKQRVAMARAFLVNRSILLLDDVFSAVDVATERRIFSAIRENFMGRTVLLITHRISILNQLDRVVYMMKGHVEEDGSPKELLKKKGYFAALVDLQNKVIE